MLPFLCTSRRQRSLPGPATKHISYVLHCNALTVSDIVLHMLAIIISAVAVLVSVVSFLFSYRASQRAERRARMPVLCLFPGEAGWQVRNVGNGPALNIIIAQGRGSKQNKDLINLGEGVVSSEVWLNPVHLRPMSAGDIQSVPWKYQTSGIGISYRDSLSFPYTMKTSKIGSSVMEGVQIPEWPHTDWVQLNEIHRMTPGAVWAQRPERQAK
jgi:hypothetical protein